MKKLEEEAEDFSTSFPISPNSICGEAYRTGINDGYIFGANSKYVKRKIIEAKIELLTSLGYDNDNEYIIEFNEELNTL